MIRLNKILLFIYFLIKKKMIKFMNQIKSSWFWDKIVNSFHTLSFDLIVLSDDALKGNFFWILKLFSNATEIYASHKRSAYWYGGFSLIKNRRNYGYQNVVWKYQFLKFNLQKTTVAGLYKILIYDRISIFLLFFKKIVKKKL